ncbi:MAG: hypothetical protein M0019_09715 [Actinomycetota bacterium]|nr:hypothetical protein [Actinomycetota bacterium]
MTHQGPRDGPYRAFAHKAFEVVPVRGSFRASQLFDGPASLAIFYKSQSGISEALVMRFLDDLETSKVKIVYLFEVERYLDLAQEFSIEFSPTSLRFDSRREIKRVVGLPPAKVFAGRLGL